MTSSITRQRGSLGVTAALAAILLTTACGQIYPSKEPTDGPANGVKRDVHDVVVGFAQQQVQAPYFSAMQVKAEEIARQQGFTLLFQSANKDPVIQMNQMQAMLAQGADVLIVNATSVKGQKEMMTQISSTVPVTYIDTSVPGTGMTSVQSDNVTIGSRSGEAHRQTIPGPGQVQDQNGHPHRPGHRRVRRPQPAPRDSWTG